MGRAVALVVLAVLSAVSGCARPSDGVGPLVGDRAADFTLVPLDQGPWTLSTHEGKTVLLDLFGVNCPPCRRQVPHLLELWSAHAHDPAFAMVSIDMASVFPALGARGEEDLRGFADEFNATWPFAPDPSGTVGRAYEPIILSTLVLIGPDGVIAAKWSGGEVHADELERAIAATRGP